MRFGPLAEAREVLKGQGNQVLKDPECSKYHSAITDWPGQHHYWCRWTSPLPQWGNVVPVKASPLYSSSICWPNLDHIFIICMPRSREKVKKLFFPQIGRRHFISSIIHILGYSSETEKRVRCSTAEPERCPEHLQKSLQNENYYPHFIVMGTKAQKKKKNHFAYWFIKYLLVPTVCYYSKCWGFNHQQNRGNLCLYAAYISVWGRGTSRK